MGNCYMTNTPAYLQMPSEEGYLYGSLSYEEEQQSWIIDAEPCVIEMARRLFPACDSFKNRNDHTVRFYRNKRTDGDLNWLLLRYPLKIDNKEEYIKIHKKTIEHVMKQQSYQLHPTKITPPARFKGDLLEFQKESLSYLLQNRKTLLADEMGLGKTPISLSFLATINKWPALIILPPQLQLGWCEKISQFLSLPDVNVQETLFENKTEKKEIASESVPGVHVIHGLRPYALPSAQIYIIHYLLLRGWRKILPDFGFKTVIFDEIQELRHCKSEKYSVATLISERCENVIGLSGTPIYNKGAEIWNVMNAIEYHCLSDLESFTRAWCTCYNGEIVKDPILLGDYLRREGLMVRHTKADVLSELPAKRRIVEPIDVDDGLLHSMLEKTIIKAQKLDLIENILERGRMKQRIVDEARLATGVAKAASVCAFVRMLLEAGEHVLLFAYHHAVVDIYLKELKVFSPVEITGRKNQKEKNEAIKQYASGNTNLAILNLRTTAGLDGLQYITTCVVFGELDWSPAVHSQCEDRTHRMGLKQSILCYYLVASDGSDANMQEALGLKVSQFVGLMGDKTETEADRVLAQVAVKKHMSNIIERLQSMKSTKKG